MKRFGVITAAFLLIGTVTCALAQSQEPPSQNQPPGIYGRGRGGLPYAWNDLNRDGRCDLTGRPVGLRPIGFGRGWGRWSDIGPTVGQDTLRYGRVGVPYTGQGTILYGRGRGGVPYAWNDVNRDGLCDLSGQPVGQRPIVFGGGRGRVGGWGRGTGRGRGGRWR
jgi:hypothetical protein